MLIARPIGVRRRQSVCPWEREGAYRLTLAITSAFGNGFQEPFESQLPPSEPGSAAGIIRPIMPRAVQRKMRVVLTESVKGLGEAGQIKEVADGYARNFLIPRGLAQLATSGAVKLAEARAAAEARRRAAEQRQRLAEAKQLEAMTLVIPSRAGETGRLFGAVTAADIASALEAQAGLQLDKRQIEMEEPLRRIGSHHVSVNLHHGVVARLGIEIEPEH